MRVDGFIEALPEYHKVTGEQAGNLEGVRGIGRDFHRSCGVATGLAFDFDVDDVVVLESGHQPNFLPYSGVWRKVFLLDYIAGELRERGRSVLPVFGFADYNLSTTSLLYQNKLPDVNRFGYRKVGFDVEKGDRWKRFDSIPKPDEELFEAQLREIVSMYESNSKRARVPYEGIGGKITSLTDLLRDCYRSADSFSDFNAYSFARVCADLLDLDVIFFRYSDIQRKKIFLDACERLVRRTSEYNSACNASVQKRGLQDLGYVEEYFFPFWHHCDCGGKVVLSLYEGVCQGRCPVCDKGRRLRLGDGGEGLEKVYASLAPTGIARNIIFSEGLGTTLFISGSGGGLTYGMISNDISDALGFHKPYTMAWKARDYYVGVSHAVSLGELAKALDVRPDGLVGADLRILMEGRRADLTRLLEETGDSDRKLRQKYLGQLKNVDTQSKIASNLFNVVPSALDIFVNIGFEKTVGSWREGLAASELKNGEFKVIDGKITYGLADGIPPFADIPDLYTKTSSLQ